MRAAPLLLCLATLLGCGDHPATRPVAVPDTTVGPGLVLPAEQDAAQLPQTLVVATLGEAVPAEKNIAYTPGLQLAWQRLRRELPGNVLVDPGAPALERLDGAREYAGALDSGSWQSSAQVHEDQVSVRTVFSKTLRFARPFLDETQPLVFGHDSVAAFGVGEGDYALRQQVRIDYYTDDDHFALHLAAADSSEELILAKGLGPAPTLIGQLKQLESWLRQGPRQYLEQIDRLAVPVIALNMRAHVPELEGSGLSAGGRHWRVAEATQRTGFLLNRGGALLESESEMTVATDTMAPVPKRLYFNKPFLLLLRKRGAPVPYFVLRIANAELLLRNRNTP